MHTITLYRWIVTGRDGRRRPTRHRMTADEALATDPTAEPIPDTREDRLVDLPQQHQGHACIAGRQRHE